MFVARRTKEDVTGADRRKQRYGSASTTVMHKCCCCPYAQICRRWMPLSCSRRRNSCNNAPSHPSTVLYGMCLQKHCCGMPPNGTMSRQHTAFSPAPADVTTQLLAGHALGCVGGAPPPEHLPASRSDRMPHQDACHPVRTRAASGLLLSDVVGVCSQSLKRVHHEEVSPRQQCTTHMYGIWRLCASVYSRSMLEGRTSQAVSAHHVICYLLTVTLDV